MKLSDKAIATKERILESANELFYLHGYNATGLDKVIKDAGVTKGNFYYYFKSKEELAISTLDWQFQKVVTDLAKVMSNGNNSPLDTLFAILNLLADKQKSQLANGHICGCYFGNFTLELSTASEGIRQKVKDVFNEYVATFSSLLSKAKNAGEIGDHIDPDTASSIILSQIEGAILLDKARQESRTFDQSIDFIRGYLIKTPR